MTKFPGLGLVYVLTLYNQGKRLLRPRGVLETVNCIGICCKSIIVIIAVLMVLGSAFWVAPYAILQNIIPDITTSRTRNGRITSNFVRIYGVRVFIHRFKTLHPPSCRPS